jgi:hypothetical protein
VCRIGEAGMAHAMRLAPMVNQARLPGGAYKDADQDGIRNGGDLFHDPLYSSSASASGVSC